MDDYIFRKAAIEAFDDPSVDRYYGDVDPDSVIRVIESIPAADVLPRDEAIKMGAELAAMHGSDATSQQLEEAYLKGVEYGMTRRDVRPVVRGKWIMTTERFAPERICSSCKCRFPVLAGEGITEVLNYCSNCGADMREES